MPDIEMSKEVFMSLSAAHYDKLAALGEQPDFFAFEAEFDKVWTELGRQVLQTSISKPIGNHRKKTSFVPGTDALV